MTSPPQRITVDCPECRELYEAWWRPSINLSLGEAWTDEEMAEAATARCPSCRHVVELEALIVDVGARAPPPLSTH